MRAPRWLLSRVALTLALSISMASLHSAAQQANSAPAATPADRSDAIRIGIDQFKFTPDSVKIVAGTTVTWINSDGEPHTVTSTDQRFKSSAALDTDDRFSYTFAAPGTYAYICSIHPFMRGAVTVVAVPGRE